MRMSPLWPTLLVASLALVASLISPHAQTPPSAVATITALVKTWDDAYMHRDVSALDRVLADEYVLTDASGRKLTKKEYLMSVVKSPDTARTKSWASENLEVHVSKDTATVTGESAVKGRARGRGFTVPARYRFTDTWVLRNGQWRAVGTVATKI